MTRIDEAVLSVTLATLDWDRAGDELVKVVRGEDFAAALAYVNAVARLAEQADHHPDIDIRWNTVTLRLTTHSAGGLTSKDVELAGAIDRLAVGPSGPAEAARAIPGSGSSVALPGEPDVEA